MINSLILGSICGLMVFIITGLFGFADLRTCFACCKTGALLGGSFAIFGKVTLSAGVVFFFLTRYDLSAVLSIAATALNASSISR